MLHSIPRSDQPPCDPRYSQLRARGRCGFSVLELSVAMVVFGIVLAGLCPHAVMHIKHLRRLESRFSPQTTYYLAPSMDRWVRKLGATATLYSSDPGAMTPTADPPPINEVAITSVEKSMTSEEVTVRVTVETIAP
jgi:prepilin-type N-terminal cleavage/methylation domain-containing protein